MQIYSGSVAPERTHGEATWKDSAVDKGGVDRGRGVKIAYVVSFPRVLNTVRCLVPGCPAVAHSAGHMR